jgi:hypothetical protein
VKRAILRPCLALAAGAAVCVAVMLCFHRIAVDVVTGAAFVVILALWVSEPALASWWLARNRPTPVCEGWTAYWCPVHGDCSCPRAESGDCNFDGSNCPLHSEGAGHALVELPDLRVRVERTGRWRWEWRVREVDASHTVGRGGAWSQAGAVRKGTRGAQREYRRLERAAQEEAVFSVEPR